MQKAMRIPRCYNKLDAVDLNSLRGDRVVYMQDCKCNSIPHPNPALIPDAQSCTLASFARTDYRQIARNNKIQYTIIEVLSRIDSQTKWRRIKKRGLPSGAGILWRWQSVIPCFCYNRYCLISTSTCSFHSMMCMRSIQADVLRPTGWHESAMVTAAILEQLPTADFAASPTLILLDSHALA